jgi:hypothetical protein
VTADANGSGLAAGAVVWIRDLAGSKGLGGEHRTLNLALTLIRGSGDPPVDRNFALIIRCSGGGDWLRAKFGIA